MDINHKISNTEFSDLKFIYKLFEDTKSII
jgi:hypothetical protein